MAAGQQGRLPKVLTVKLVNAIALGAAGTLAACTVGPNYQAPTAERLDVPADYHGRVAGDGSGVVDLKGWWRTFRQPLLDRLIAQAIDRSPSVAVGVARLRQSRALLGAAEAERRPSLSATGGSRAHWGNTPTDRTAVNGAGEANWEADLFGGRARDIEAAQADFQAAGYDLQSISVSLAAEVATNYVSAANARVRKEIAQQSLRTQDEVLQIARWRSAAGLVSSLDVEQATVQRALTAAMIPALDAALARSLHRIAALIGESPAAVHVLFSSEHYIPVASDHIAIGIPADTLVQRPDIRRAERHLAATTARIGSAEARLYPALRLSGNIGSAALSVGALGDVLVGALVASVTAPLLDGGRIRQQIAIRTAEQEGAFARYRQVVMTALEEVENALATGHAARQRQAILTVAVEAARNAATLGRMRYATGATDFVTLLEAERSLLSARGEMADATAERAAALIQLYRALGGGWQPIDPVKLTSKQGTP